MPPNNDTISKLDFVDGYPTQHKKAGYRTGFKGGFFRHQSLRWVATLPNFRVTVDGLGKFVIDRSADPLLSTTRHPTKLGVINVAKRLVGGAISDDCRNGYVFVGSSELRREARKGVE